jgi:hypothetical protein
MDSYNENKSVEEITNIVDTIENYLLIDDYKNAFIMFLLHIKRLNNLERDDLLCYFYNKIITKIQQNYNKNPTK